MSSEGEGTPPAASDEAVEAAARNALEAAAGFTQQGGS